MALRGRVTTPAALAGLYEWLRSASKTLSKAPPSEQIRFKWGQRDGYYGQCDIHVRNAKRGRPPIATITAYTDNNAPWQLVETMAHEMVHVIQRTDDLCKCGDLRSAAHGPKFKRIAVKVCEELHLNPHTF